MYSKLQIPELNLRPEEVDAIYVPWARGDQRKYDFDASHVDTPPFEFKLPLSDGMNNLNLKELSRTERSWVTMVTAKPEDARESAIVTRLIQMEKLQRKTVDLEREWRLNRYRRNRVRSAGGQGQIGVTTRGRQDMTCCPDCIQIACVGDCPSKNVPPGFCTGCNEKDCTGNCHVSVYENRTRLESNDLDDGNKGQKVIRPKSCASCQQRHNAKLINGNNVINGQPKSAYATFSRGQSSVRPKDLRPKSVTDGSYSELEQEFERLGLVSSDREVSDNTGKQERPQTAGTINGSRRPRGRAAIIPGKSFFSQRRNSLTDLSKEERIKSAVAASRRRIRSAKKKRPKTAS